MELKDAHVSHNDSVFDNWALDSVRAAFRTYVFTHSVVMQGIGCGGLDVGPLFAGERLAFRWGAQGISAIPVLVDPTRPQSEFAALGPDAIYCVSTTGFQALISAVYVDLFTKAGTL